MVVPRTLWLYNNTAKILCRYGSNNERSRLAAAWQNLLSTLSPSGSLQPVLSLAQVVITLGIFWIRQMDFREVI